MHANIFSPAYLMANLIGLLILIAAVVKPNIARIFLITIFIGAAFFNGAIALREPGLFMAYGDMAVFPVYEQFIYGAFEDNITAFVLSIAGCQLITGMLIAARGRLLKTGLAAAIMFLVAIAPLGAGAAFPCTLLLAAACIILLFKANYLSSHPFFYSLHHLLN